MDDARKRLAPLLCLLLMAAPFAAGAPPGVPEAQAAAVHDPVVGAVLGQAAAAVAAARVAAEDAAAPPGVEALLAEAAVKVTEAQAVIEGGAEVAPGTAGAAVVGAQAALAEASRLAQGAARDELLAALAALADARAVLDERGDAGLDTACRHTGAALHNAPIVVWTSCNMGFGSGLDADTLDGLSSEAILLKVDEERAARIAALAAEESVRAGGDDALMARLETEAALVPDTAWGAVLARDGAGSRLDADLLDGLDSARFLRSDRDGTVAGTLQVTGDFGMGTASPRARLHLVGSSNRGANIALDTAPTAAPSLNFWENGQQRAFIQKMPSTDAAYPNVLMVGTDGRAVPGNPAGISFQVYKTYGNEREAMRIADSGNVGIGTKSPEYELQVNGADGVAQFTNPAPGGYTGVLIGQNNQGSSGLFQYMSQGWRGCCGSPQEVARGNNFEIYNQHATGNLTFHTANGIVPKVTITPIGNVGIGTTTPEALLDVAGTVRADALRLDPSALGGCDGSERGKMQFVAGATGQSDELWVCMKGASGAYWFVKVASGPV